jgi:type I restriction enzyme, S subunit
MVTELEKQDFKQTMGIIADDWDVDEIQNHTKITTGSKNTQDRIKDGLYPFFVRSQKVERINTYSYDNEAVLTAGDGVGTGKVFHYINDKFDVHQRVYQISKFDTYLDGYFFYLYFSNHFLLRIMSMTAKSSVDSVRMNMIAKMLIPLPEKQEQMRIASTMRDIIELIEKLETTIEKKKNIKEGSMQELLTGKRRLTGFTEEWKETTLGKIGIFTKGKGIKKTDIADTGFSCIRYAEIYTKYDVFVKETQSHISLDITKESQQIKTGNIIFTGSGETANEIGKCVVYLGTKQCFAGGDTIIFSSNRDDSLFLTFLLNFDYVQKQKISMAQGDMVVHIYSSSLKKLKIKIPQIPEQTAIAKILSDMDSEIKELESKRDKYIMIKNGMMQKLFTGEIRLV